MTTKTINSYIAAGYTLSSAYSRLIITASGGIGGTGLLANSYAKVFNDGVVHGAGYADGVFLDAGGFVQNGDTNVTSALIEGYRGVEVQNALGTVTNFGTIVGDYRSGVFLADGGVVTNGSVQDTSALIEGGGLGIASQGLVTVNNYGTISGGLQASDGVVSNGSVADTAAAILNTVYSGIFFFEYSPPSTVTNFGTIEGGSVGVALEAGGKVTNGSGADRMALILGHDGLILDGSGTVVNAGTIEGIGKDTGGHYAYYGVYVITDATAVTLTNGSKTNAAALIEGYGGVQLFGASTAVNFGTISATGTASAAGVYIGGGDVSLTNGAVGHQTALIEGFFGLGLIGGAGTVTNFGTIKGTGGQAVLFESAADVLVVEAGCEFDGSIDGGGGTLVLASGAGRLTGNLAGGAVTVSGSMAATTFGDFNTVEIGAAATFVTSGAVTVAAGQTVIDAGLLTLGGTKAGVVNDGTIEALGGTLTVKGAVSGKGAATINGGTLDFVSAFNQNVTFSGKTGVLELARSRGYTATVAGFSKTGGTSLDLADIGFVSASEATYSGTKTGGVLTVTDGTHTAQIALVGNYLRSTFIAASDGHGRTIVHDPQAPPHRFIAAMAGVGGAGGAAVAEAGHPDAWRPVLVSARPACFA